MPLVAAPPAATTVMLDNCGRQPIRLPGQVQQHGALVALQPVTGTNTFAAANPGAWLPGNGLPARGRSVHERGGVQAFDAHVAALLHESRAAGAAMLELQNPVLQTFDQIHVPPALTMDPCSGWLLKRISARAGALWRGHQMLPFGHGPEAATNCERR